ncbi:hypothetical protein T10_10806 [Trichinella papuae]|uniref:Reverse transcriptase/retrotransposon-derived protein RNase H-like domain-containing protein n=1 Tax=Trichinella papuae TaxID=268474 RepID=A0A0V1M7G6_9BILA|nr:hypothetical protein T10_10806 [Trichinella papuae]
MLALDASPFGISAVLSHELPNESEAPVAFGSRTPRKSERNYSQLDNETLTIILKVKNFIRT